MITTASVVAGLTRSGVVAVDPPDAASGSGTLDGTLLLRLPFFEATAVLRRLGIGRALEEHVHVDAVLAPGAGRAALTHQGTLSVAALKEQKLGIKAVDDAFVVRCDDDGFALLTQCRAELLALVPKGAPSERVELHLEEARLRVIWPGDDLAALPALWERLVSLRAGG